MSKPKSSRSMNLLQSGIILSLVGFLTQGIHYGFQMIVRPQLGGKEGEFGLVTTTVVFIGFLGLPLTIATQAVTHYVARFHFSGDDARLHALLAGCRKFLLHITIAGSVGAIILVKPLGHYFNIPRTSLTLIALFCVLGGLWSSYVVAICQGLGWFKRLALIGLLAAILRVLFGLPVTHYWPVAEAAVLASAVMLLPNLILIFWKKEFPKPVASTESPWNREFVQFVIVSAACVIGSYCFGQADQLVANKFFADNYKTSLDAYSSAGLLARALPTTAGPLLVVLFTHRSGRNHKEGLGEQLKLFGLYALALLIGACLLYLLRGFCLKLLSSNTAEAMGMVGHLAITMVLAGLIQALGTWALASRWLKVSLLYGVLGVAYWLTLLLVGSTPPDLLHIMPLALGAALVIMLVIWLNTMRRHHPPTPDL
ncbi:MAG TPA: hypothetical protein VG347_14440 [Verrucomicrobiae bacterium]|nr:hypothetical protein [Verrucomicrobiae bacterium]